MQSAPPLQQQNDTSACHGPLFSSCMDGGISSPALELISVSPLPFPEISILEIQTLTRITNNITVIALVEYLTSEEAGQPLGKSFAWPVGRIVNCSAGTKEKMNGSNGHAMENGNGAVKMNGINEKKVL